MSMVLQPMYEWKTLPWKVIERRVFKLQKRIYQASRCGNVKAVHKLQRLLMKSWFAKCLATRRVTQDNQGKQTAGIDGVKALTPEERMVLVERLNLNLKAQAVRRVWIPKPGSLEQRGLGIPVMQDRALQTLVKFALEGEWEAKFEANSYGFRPGRSCHDALKALRNSIMFKPKYVLDADIAKCFDRIDHQTLLAKLQTFPALRQRIKQWLKAGIMDGQTLFPTDQGVPQGGCCSPILANIALHGMEMLLHDELDQMQPKPKDRLTVVRYADDMVILHADLAVIQFCQQRLSEFLAELGLEFKASKTRITHTLMPYNGNVGFDFLGCTIRQYAVGKTHSGRRGNRYHSTPLGFKTLITPSKAARQRHSHHLKQVIQSLRSVSQQTLIDKLNPIIRGWTNYYAPNNAKRTFNTLDYQLFFKLFSWATFRHPNKTRFWIATKYWKVAPFWQFTTPDGTRLARYIDTPIRHYTKVQQGKSPLDGDWLYWATHLGHHPQLLKRKARLLKTQHGKCTFCGLYFASEDALELDHIIPTHLGGADVSSNWQLLHKHCHDRKTTTDLAAGARDKSHIIEELDEVNVSRPVLQTSRAGDCPA